MSEDKVKSAVNKSGFLFYKLELNWTKLWLRFEGTTDKNAALWTFYTSPPVQQTQVSDRFTLLNCQPINTSSSFYKWKNWID